MRGSLSGHFVDAFSVIFNLADKHFAISRRAMTMGMQLNVNALGRKFANLFGFHDMQGAALKQSVIIHFEVCRERSSQLIFLFGGEFLLARKRAKLD